MIPKSRLPHCNPGRSFLTSLLALIVVPLATAQPASKTSGEEATDREGEAINLPAFSVSTDNPSKYQALDAVSSSRIRADLIQTPTSISVLTSAMIQDIQPQRLFDALRYLPGVADSNSPNLGDRVTLRGFAALNSGYLDGLTFNTPLQIDPIIVERQELLGGPNAVIAPNGLPGGTINTVTKSPAFNRAGTVSASVGRFNSDRVDLDTTGPIGEKSGFAYRLIASVQDGDKVSNGTKLKQNILFPSVTYRIHNTQVTYKYLYDYYKATYEGSGVFDPSASPSSDGELVKGLNFFQYVAPPDLFRTTKVRLNNILIQSDLTEHISARLFVQYTDSHQSQDSETVAASFALGGAVNPLTGIFTPGVTYSAQAPYTASAAVQPDFTRVPFSGSFAPSRNFNAVLQNDYVAKYSLLHGIQSTTTLGWQTSESKTRSATLSIASANINIFNPIWPALTPNQTANNGSDSRQTNVYFLERLALFSNRLFIDAGVQATAVRSRSDDFLKQQTSFSRGNAPTKLFALLYMITPHLSAYADYAENASPISSGLPLAPVVNQYGKQKEVGVKAEFLKRRLRLTAAYYDIQETNFGIANLAAVADPTLPSRLLLDLKSRGEEFSVTGQLTPNINVVGSYSYNHIRDPYGRRLRSVPDNVASALISYSWTQGMLKNAQVNVGASYQSRRAGDSQTGITAAGVPIQPTFYLAPLTLLRAGASYRYNRYFIRVSASNLTNKKYLFGSARITSYAGIPFNLVSEVGLKF